jgi:hypothetical protein
LEILLMAASDLPLHADGLRISPLAGRVGLWLAGEADVHTVEILRRATARLPPEAHEIHLELGGLEFIDVAAVRQLVALAERPAHPRVLLHWPPPILIWLVGLLWPDNLDRFSVCVERSAR